MNLTSINGLLLKKMVIAGANELNDNKQLVDSLNVFPVPDGDTGTNMSLTALAAARECEKSASDSVGDMAKAIASGSLRGARGNSGVILSQLFRGFSKELDGKEEATTKELALAARMAVKTAYKAVMKPKEGTILTVARACADAAEKYAEEIDDIEEFIKKILEEGNEMLLRTPDMLPVLKQANVVDAGGKGLLCIISGALKSISVDGEIVLKETLTDNKQDFNALSFVDTTDIKYGYCTEFFILQKNVPEKTVDSLVSYFSALGDSIVVVADEEVVKIHVHSNHPGKIIEKALTVGPLSDLKIDNMRLQHDSKIDFNVEKEDNKKFDEKKEVGFIAISMGSGLSEIFTNLGVDKIIEGGQTMNPSTEDILNAIEAVNADSIVVLPNNKNIILAAEQAAKLAKDKKVYVLPSTTVPEGVAAMIGYDANGGIEESFDAMVESLGFVKTCAVTYAVRDTVLGDADIKEGDILGMIGSKIEVVAKDVEEGTKELISKAIDDDSEVISIFYGADVPRESAENMLSYVEEEFPGCEVELHLGNQPLYYYIISVE